MSKNENAGINEYKYEKSRDFDGRFFALHYMSYGLLQQFHACMEIFAVIKGKVDAVINGQHHLIGDGDVLLINSFEMHSYTTEGEAEVACILIGNECLNEFEQQYHGYEFITRFKDRQRALEIIDLIVKIEKEQQNYDLFEQKGYSDLLFSKIVKGGGVRLKTWAGNAKISNIIKYIYENSEKDMSLKNIAAAFNYAPMSVSHMFSHFVGSDLRSFVNEVRIQKAYRMLNDKKYSNHSVLDVASYCGFNSAATFYRAYRKRYGVTPRR